MGSASANRAIRLDGAKCALERARAGLSQQRLAEESKGGLSVATIKRLEAGAAVYVDTARRLSALLGVPLRALAADGELRGELAPVVPMIAVLPFDTFGVDEASRYFADGLVEDLITRLGRRWFPVISRSSTFKFRDTRPVAAELGMSLGADYLIEGSVRRDDARLRVTARLTEAATARQLWANQYECAFAGVFDAQDALVAAIVTQVDTVLVAKTVKVTAYRDPKDLNAWELSLRGSHAFHRRSKTSNVEARAFFEQAVRLDQNVALAWYFLALTHQRSIINQWSTDLAQTMHDMASVCGEFEHHHPDDAGLRIAKAYWSVYAGDRAGADLLLSEAIGIDPNAATAYSLYGQTLAMGNEPEAAIEQFELALRLSPCDGDAWSVQTGLGLCHFVSERYDEMLFWGKRAITSRPEAPFPLSVVAVAHTALGDEEGAAKAVGEMLRLEPTMSVGRLSTALASTHPDIAKRYIEGLRRAGVPA